MMVVVVIDMPQGILLLLSSLVCGPGPLLDIVMNMNDLGAFGGQYRALDLTWNW